MIKNPPRTETAVQSSDGKWGIAVGPDGCYIRHYNRDYMPEPRLDFPFEDFGSLMTSLDSLIDFLNKQEERARGRL